FMANFEKESNEAMKGRIDAHERYIKSLEDMANNPAHSPAQRAHGLKIQCRRGSVVDAYQRRWHCILLLQEPGVPFLRHE
ncbi:MAG: hypothetical protein ACKPKO_60855, partial [Candidatus Fonsibacter sp.]